MRVQAAEKILDACSRVGSRFALNALSPIPSLFDKGIVDTVAAHASCCSNQFRVGRHVRYGKVPRAGFVCLFVVLKHCRDDCNADLA